MKVMSSKGYLIILTIIGFLLYLPSLFGGFIWDDEDFVVQNTFVKDFQITKLFTDQATAGTGKPSNYYRPIQMTIYALIHSIVGFTPFWFHLTNVVFHIAATIAIFIFLKKWFSSIPGIKVAPIPGIAFLTSLFFLIHPVQTESVTYISGLSDSLFVLFGVLSLILSLSWEQNRVHYLSSILFFLLSLLSKETGLVFCGLITIFELQKRRPNLLTLLPFFMLSLGYYYYHETYISLIDQRALWLASNPVYASSLLVRLLTFINNLFTYVGLLIFPKDLFMERDVTVVVQTAVNPQIVLFFTINALLLYFLIKKRKLLTIRYSLLSYIAFYISFIPYTGIVLINGFFYEHFLYFPLLWFFTALLLYISKWFGRKTYLIIALIAILFVLRNIVRQLDWIDPIRFYEKTATHAKSFRVINNLGISYAQKGDTDRAIQTYENGLIYHAGVPNLWHNLANAYISRGDLDSAEHYLLQAIKVGPGFHQSYIVLRLLYEQTGQKEKTMKLQEDIDRIFLYK